MNRILEIAFGLVLGSLILTAIPLVIVVCLYVVSHLLGWVEGFLSK